MRALEVASPQATPETVLCRVGNPNHLLLILEPRHRHKRPEHLFLANAVARLRCDNRRFDVTAGTKFGILERFTTSENRAALFPGHLDVPKNAVAVAG